MSNKTDKTAEAAAPAVENVATQASTSGVKKHIAEVFGPLATTTSIVKCGKAEAKITFVVNGKNMTAYIRASRGAYILQMPFSKAEKVIGPFIDDKMFDARDTTKQRVYKFATPAQLMEVAEEAYAQSQNVKTA
jgi:hypothetical protein